MGNINRKYKGESYPISQPNPIQQEAVQGINTSSPSESQATSVTTEARLPQHEAQSTEVTPVAQREIHHISPTSGAEAAKISSKLRCELMYRAVADGNFYMFYQWLRSADETVTSFWTCSDKYALHWKILKLHELNCMNDNGYTALMFAIAARDEIAVEHLVTAENIKTKNKYGETVLFLAVCTRNYNIVNTLIKNGADVNVTNNAGYPPASYTCSAEIINLLGVSQKTKAPQEIA